MSKAKPIVPERLKTRSNAGRKRPLNASVNKKKLRRPSSLMIRLKRSSASRENKSSSNFKLRRLIRNYKKQRRTELG